jgi:hypothetical protein
LFTAAVGLNPTLLLYENLLFYSHVEALGVLAAFWAALSAGAGRPRWGIFVIATSTLMGIRPMFHPIWIGAVLFCVATSLRRLDPRTWVLLTVPLLCSLLFHAKNKVVFDIWSVSSWSGHNLSRFVSARMGERVQLFANEGIVSEVFVAGPFAPPAKYPPELVERSIKRAMDRYGQIPALLMPLKRNSIPNYNHLLYLDTSKQLATDSLTAARLLPRLMWRTALEGFTLFHGPASRYFLLDANRERIGGLEMVYTAVLYPWGSHGVVRAAVIVTILTSLAVWLFPLGSFRTLAPAAGFVVATVVWVTVASNIAEFGENQRFRFTIDATVVTWLAVCGLRLVHARSSGTGGADPSGR